MFNGRRETRIDTQVTRLTTRARRDGRTPVYYISIVAQMVETHPQTLRMYERMGLVAPRRTRNNVRLYSDDDVEQVRRIQHLTQELGVNLAGVEVVFKLLKEMDRLRAEVQSQLETVTGQSESAATTQVVIGGETHKNGSSQGS